MPSIFPLYLSILFIAITLASLILFAWVIKRERNVAAVLAGLVLWLALQAVFSLRGIYSTNTMVMPPKLFLLGLLPPVLTIIIVLLTKTGRAFADRLSKEKLIYIHTVRIPVEIGLFFLYGAHLVPKLMTFEGGNLDIISGISAPVVGYLVFKRKLLGRNALLAWNFICLGLLLNILTRALLSAPFPFQRMGFDQPNMAILHFPVIFLPTFIVPMVLFSHLVMIRQLLISNDLHATNPVI